MINQPIIWDEIKHAIVLWTLEFYLLHDSSLSCAIEVRWFCSLLCSGLNFEERGEMSDVYKFFEKFWEWRMVNSPEFATLIGDNRYDDKLFDHSLKSYEERKVRSCWSVTSIFRC